MAAGSKKPIAVYGAIVANALIAVTKFAAAAFTGSSAMISEGIHSVVDTGNQSLLLLGTHLSKKPADEMHPFGHGKELYFWGLIVAVILFGLGGGISLYEGIAHLQHPTELGDPTWNYVVLGIAFVVESIAFAIALRELFHVKGKEDFWSAVRTSKNPAIFVVLFEDFAALGGLVIAALGIFLGHTFQNPYLDGIASILIGVLLASVAVFLAYESRKLLLGESADKQTVQNIRSIAEQDSNVVSVKQPYTMHFGPNQILLNLSIQFEKSLNGRELAKTVDRLEKRIQEEYPEVKHIFIEAESITKARPSENGKQAEKDNNRK